jgi:uncharacterized protein (TIGR02678 family)
MSLTDTLAANRIQALTRIRRRLLADPLLHRADEPELWPTVLRYGADLARWFAVNLGWRLVVDPAGGFARLHKIAARPDPTRPARLNDTPLTPRKYTLLFLACAALDEQPRQTTLSILSENVAELSMAEDSIPTFDPSNSHSDRVAFAGAIRWLAANRIIAVRDGNLDEYTTDPTTDALLDVNDRLLAHLLSCPTSPALADDPADVLQEVYPSGSAGDTSRAGHRVLRQLADDPLVYHEDLDAAERDWLTPRWQVVNRVAADLGLTLERRAEGFAAVDPSTGEPMTDDRFPIAGSTVAHCSLLLAEYLVNRHQASRSAEEGRNGVTPEPEPVPNSELAAHVRILIGDYAARCGWAQWVLDEDGPAQLTGRALDYLARFRLVHRLDHAVVPAPAVARFGVASPTAKEPNP